MKTNEKWLIAGLLAVGVGYWYFSKPTLVACPMDAMLCPDGSYVGRTGADCTFTPCSNCTCPTGFIQEGNVCNPSCYYSTPRCLMASRLCS